MLCECSTPWCYVVKQVCVFALIEQSFAGCGTFNAEHKGGFVSFVLRQWHLFVSSSLIMRWYSGCITRRLAIVCLECWWILGSGRLMARRECVDIMLELAEDLKDYVSTYAHWHLASGIIRHLQIIHRKLCTLVQPLPFGLALSHPEQIVSECKHRYS